MAPHNTQASETVEASRRGGRNSLLRSSAHARASGMKAVSDIVPLAQRRSAVLQERMHFDLIGRDPPAPSRLHAR
jgi:hypothetical protein